MRQQLTRCKDAFSLSRDHVKQLLHSLNRDAVRAAAVPIRHKVHFKTLWTASSMANTIVAPRRKADRFVQSTTIGSLGRYLLTALLVDIICSIGVIY
jgi:hypothetical protein